VRTWLLVDADLIGQHVRDRIDSDPTAFLHPSAGHYCVPVDQALESSAIEQLVRDGIPRRAISRGGR
jgi:hypothetical protein